LFLVVGLAALLWRRPRHAVLALALGAAAILVVLFNAVTIYPIIEFAVPVVPALVLLSAAGLVGERVGGRPSRLES
jgi:peptidoglycan/LPS O-acetylase OafA/YrhL